jgi:phosphatidylinositol alpha-1,6-mannosyltransferase
VPVVAGDSGGAPETVRDGETGRVVDGRSHDQIVEVISGLLADPAAALRMGQAGREWIRRDWNWDAHTARLGQLLRVSPVRR